MTKRTQAELEQAILAAVPANLIDAEGFSEAGKLTVAKEQATRRVNDGYSEAMNALVAEYPETERESWSKQESEARAWLADNTAPTPFMDAVLLVRTDTTKTQLANRIITKSDALADATGQLTGKRHVLEGQIEAATTTSEVEAIAQTEAV